MKIFYQNTVVDGVGNPITGVSVYVYGDANTLAPLYNVSNVSVTNPVVTDAQGRFTFYIEEGYYRLSYFYNNRRLYEEPSVFIGGVGGGGGSVTAIQITTALGYTPIDADGARAAAVQNAIGSETAKAPSQASVAGALATPVFSNPAIILPASTKTLDIRGHATVGDRYADAAYREVATEPSHPGKLSKDGKWYELMDEYALADKFYRTGDTNDAASFLRARDFMLRKVGPVVLKLQPRVYDCDGVSMDFGGIAAQFIGSGHSEVGDVGGFNSNYNTGLTEPSRGTWIRAGVSGTAGTLPPPAFNVSGGNARGTRFDKIGFVQSHPAPGSGWAPTNYGFLIQSMNSQGGLDIGEIMLAGINKAIFSDNSGRLTVDRLRGQVFTDGILVDHAYDVTYINHVHFWPYGAGSLPIATYTQANMRGLRMGRCDGVNVNHFFQIQGFRGHSFEGGLAFDGLQESKDNNPLWSSLSKGPVTDFRCFWLYADQTKVGVYGVAPNIEAHYAALTGQCENLSAQDGSAIANSAAIKLDSAAVDGLISLGRVHCERATNIVKSVTNTTIEVAHSPFARYMPNSGQLFSAPTPVLLQRSPIWPQNCPAGVYGTDYTVTDDQIVYNYSTSLSNSSGQVIFAHGLGSGILPRIRSIFMHAKGNSGESIGMTYLSADGTNIAGVITNDPTIYPAGRPVRVSLRLYRFGDSW